MENTIDYDNVMFFTVIIEVCYWLERNSKVEMPFIVYGVVFLLRMF